MSKLKDEIARTRWGCIGFVVLGGPLIMMLLCSGWPHIDHTTEQDAKDRYTEWTGLPWPQSGKIIGFGDDHGIFHLSSEGDYFFVFEVDDEALEEILKRQPESPSPEEWLFSDWQQGPVPNEIGSHRRFSTNATFSTHAYSSVNEQDVSRAFNSAEIFYSASERCCEGLAWHNGTLIVVDPPENRIWVCDWDY